MINLYINHKNEFEISNLIKNFFFRDKVKIFQDENLFEELSSDENIKIYSLIQDDKLRSGIEYKERNINCELDIKDIYILEDDYEKRVKIGIRRSLYEVLSEYIEKDINWGILTGVRPVKIVHHLFELGYDKIDIKKLLLREYKISEDKANLIIDIAELEKEIIYPLDKNRYSLYIGIPFCPTRCSYCSFTSNRYDKKIADKYLDYLEYEIERISELLSDKKLNTIYIGGGTPTALNSEQLERLLKKIRKYFETEGKEFTVEAGRPDTIDIKKLEILREYGVNRISINPQTMNDDILKKIDREHDSKDIIDKYNLAKNIGFDSINMDLIVGLPGEGIEHIERTMKELEKLDPDNITVHTMAIKKVSKISKNIEDYDLTQAETIENMLEITKRYLEKMELYPYYMYRQKQILGNFENIGYAKVCKECIYNISMMEEKETIIALGVGSVSKIFFPEEDRIERVPNFKDLNVYFERIDEVIERKKIFVE